MFDVMRVNDTEVNKKYNPTKARERSIEKELKAKFNFSEDINLYINSEYIDPTIEHSFKQYISNYSRVIDKHIEKLPIWEKEHPEIKNKGFLIYDETELYFEGISCHNPHSKDPDSWIYAFQGNSLILHKPWEDITFMQMLFKSKLDFVIFYFPYKPFGLVRNLNLKYPQIVICDIRYSEPKYKTYNYSKMVTN